MNLQQINKEQAYTELLKAYPKEQDWFLVIGLDYWAYPQTFSNTGGPFAKEGGFYGQAFTTFTVEAWVCGKFAVLFCSDKVIKVVDNWDGPGSVRF